MRPAVPPGTPLPKCPTGIRGFDLVTGGGLPRGRGTLLSGPPGSGKTLFGLEFLVHGAAELGEPGLFISFRESPAELVQNAQAFGWDLPRLVEAGSIAFEHVTLGPEAVEAGSFDLSALIARIGAKIAAVGAQRVAIDTLESLYAALPNPRLLRAEIERLFAWLKEQGVSAVLTAERVDGQLSRTGIEEFVGDCVISLDHRVSRQISTRTLRVVKYRGSAHGTNEYPFVIDESGIRVLPITEIRLEHPAPPERIPTGIPDLDEVVGGGYYRGSSVLISGGAGTGKTTVAAAFAEAACVRGGRAAYLAFEESCDQVVRNMGEIGLRLRHWLDEGRLRIQASRPSSMGLERHLADVQNLVEAFDPHVIVLDPITAFDIIGEPWEVRSMLVRLVDFLKSRKVTALMTTLTGAGPVEDSRVGISAFIDTWLVLRSVEVEEERTRLLHVVKARGSAHSNQVREFVLSADGVHLVGVDVGPEGVLVGSARARHRAALEAARLQREVEWSRRRRELQEHRRLTEARIAALQAHLASKEEALREEEAAARARFEADRVGWRSEADARHRGKGPERP